MTESILCVGVVVRKGLHVLLVRQAEGHPLQHQWTIPWGRVHVQESPLDAAMRETREEAGVASQVIGLLGLQELPPPQQERAALIFLARHVDGTPAGDGRETDAAQYFTDRDLETLREPVEPFSDWLVRRVFQNQHTVTAAHLATPFAPHRAFI